MNPDTGAMYATVEEAVEAGEKREDLVLVEGRREQIDKMITDLQKVDLLRIEEHRQAAKKRRVAAQASRKKNRRKR